MFSAYHIYIYAYIPTLSFFVFFQVRFLWLQISLLRNWEGRLKVRKTGKMISKWKIPMASSEIQMERIFHYLVDRNIMSYHIATYPSDIKWMSWLQFTLHLHSTVGPWLTKLVHERTDELVHELHLVTANKCSFPTKTAIFETSEAWNPVALPHNGALCFWTSPPWSSAPSRESVCSHRRPTSEPAPHREPSNRTIVVTISVGSFWMHSVGFFMCSLVFLDNLKFDEIWLSTL